MATLILFNKPYRVLSQFRDPQGRRTLADFITRAGVYPAGRLDYDSEGLLLLTDDGQLQARIASPRHRMRKTYLAQVLGQPAASDLQRLTEGLPLKDGISRAVAARLLPEAPGWLPERDPPVVERHAAQSSWLEVQMQSGRNREVRRLLAAAGYPVLRLMRTAIGTWQLDGLAPGTWQETQVHLPRPRPAGKVRPKGRR